MAGFYGVDAIRTLRFEVVDPRQLDWLDTIAASALFQESLEADFPSRSAEAIMNAVSTREAARLAISSLEQGGVEGTYQRRIRPRTVLAYDQDDVMVGYMDTTDNSSSREGSRIPRLEIFGKLHVPQLVSARYHAVGMVALAKNMRPPLGEPFQPDTINIVDAMHIAATAHQRKGGQSVAGYSQHDLDELTDSDESDPGEYWLEGVFESWGLESKPDERIPKYDFGKVLPVMQQRWVRSAGLENVDRTIRQKMGGVTAASYIVMSSQDQA